MHRTLIIRREYLHFIPKYSRYEKRHKNLAAHVSPAFRVEDGDQVTVGQCRPLSKTVCTSGYQPWIGIRETAQPGRISVLIVARFLGPIQRSPCPTSHRQKCQVVYQILGDIQCKGSRSGQMRLVFIKVQLASVRASDIRENRTTKCHVVRLRSLCGLEWLVETYPAAFAVFLQSKTYLKVACPRCYCQQCVKARR